MKPKRLTFAQYICRYLPPIISQRIRTLIYPFNIAISHDYNFSVNSQTGSIYSNTTSNFGSYQFCVHGYNIWRNWAVAIAVVKLGDTIVEIGANIGTETIGFIDIVGVNGKVIAIEPNPNCVDIIQQQIKINKLQSLNVLNVAIGKSNRAVNFVLPPSNRSTTGHIARNDVSDQNTISVQCMTLDTFTNSLESNTLLVIDTEGFDLEVLIGGREYIKKHRPTILIEAKSKHLKKLGYVVRDLYSEITQHSYDIFKLNRISIQRIELPLAHSYDCDWICIPKEKSQELAYKINKSVKLCGILPCISMLNPMVLN